MASSKSSVPTEWDFPRLRCSFFLTEQQDATADPQEAQGEFPLRPDEVMHTDSPLEFFDVKFYPYNPPGALPIFAATSKKHVVICRLSQPPDKETNPCEVIQVIRDDDDTAKNCSSCWSKNPETGRPWLCIAGNDAKVKIYDVKEGKLVNTLVGHGAGINDLATSPANPLIIASASEDTTVRIWSLATAHAQQPCLCLLGGEGHAWDLLSVAWHDTGRYVLSAGHDQVINMWAIPELPEQHVEVPIIIHYPHFSSSEVHSGLVDCVAFYGDLILSRACHEDVIVLWRIEGFSSDDPVPTPDDAPTTYDPAKQTRSGWTPTLSPDRPVHFTRLLQFHTPDCGAQFFMRFRMFHSPGRHPILAFANAKSKTFFWDMSRFLGYAEYMESLRDAQAARAAAPPPRPAWLVPKRAKRGDAAAATSLVRGVDKDSMVSASPDPDPGLWYDAKTLAHWAEMYSMSSSHVWVEPHKTVAMQVDGSFVGRQVGWSPGGEWCVVVGNANRAVIYQRWPGGLPAESE